MNTHLLVRSELSIVEVLLYELFTELWLDSLCVLYFAVAVYDMDGSKPWGQLTTIINLHT